MWHDFFSSICTLLFSNFVYLMTEKKEITYASSYIYILKLSIQELACCHSPLGKFLYFPLIMDNVHNLGFKFLIISVVSTIIKIFKECN